LPAGNNKQFNMRSFRRKSSRRWQIAQSWGVTFPWKAIFSDMTREEREEQIRISEEQRRIAEEQSDYREPQEYAI
jgi:hypothetical protein